MKAILLLLAAAAFGWVIYGLFCVLRGAARIDSDYVKYRGDS